MKIKQADKASRERSMMDRRERAWILVWAALAGAALLLLHKWLLTLTPEAMRPEMIWPLYFLAIAIPLNMQMLSSHRKKPSMWLWSGCFALITMAVASYMGYQSWTSELDIPRPWNGHEFWNAVNAVFFSWLLLIPFVQHRLGTKRWFGDYGSFFSLTLSNTVKLSVAGLFVVLFWGLLVLWASLFQVVKIDFFTQLFFDKNFVYPATALAFGLGLSLYAAKEGTLTAFCRASLGIVGWLLPLVALIALLFLLSLPFKGLEGLWSTKAATPLMLALLFALIVVLNAACQDYRKPIGLPDWLLRFVSLAILVMPVYCALCAYSLGLRVMQHGWSIGRFGMALQVLIFAIYSLGYAVACVRKGAVWMEGAGTVNMCATLASCALYILAATPLLDPARISVDNQIRRLMTGKVEAEKFDFSYLRFSTGRYGNEKLRELAALSGHPQAKAIQELAARQMELKHPPARKSNNAR